MSGSCFWSAFVVLVTVAVASFGEPRQRNDGLIISKPAYVDQHPKVVVDEAHFNRYTVDGLFKPVVDLLRSDGCVVTGGGKQKFSKQSLEGMDILVVAGAWGAPDRHAAAKPAFTDDECDVVREWVRSGGGLLLIADHWPGNAAAAGLAQRFDVEMSRGITVDKDETGKYSGSILFTREKGLIRDHPVTLGRSTAEKINKVRTLTGQSLKGPEGSVPFLVLTDMARERLPPDLTEIPASGRAQGLALRFGEGRVVVLGETSMLPLPIAEPDRHFGIDNQQLALNIFHWLSGLLDE
jgi:hypothetical protein